MPDLRTIRHSFAMLAEGACEKSLHHAVEALFRMAAVNPESEAYFDEISDAYADEVAKLNLARTKRGE